MTTIQSKELQIERLVAELAHARGDAYMLLSHQIDVAAAELRALIPPTATPTMPADRRGLTMGGPVILTGPSSGESSGG